MPRFSDSEKTVIHKRLKESAINLFSQYGLKKVTVDDLVNATNIAKGSFYAFYENKEQLFMELNVEEQEKIFTEIEEKLQSRKDNAPQVLTCYAINLALEKFICNPILTQINDEIFDYLQRKIPEEKMDEHVLQDSQILKKLEQYGVEFTCPLTIVAKVLHPIFAYAISIQHDADYEEVMAVLINGIVSQTVK